MNPPGYWIISIMAAMTIGSLSLALSVIRRRRRRPVQPGSLPTREILSALRPPAVLFRRWTGENVARRLRHAGLNWRPETYAGMRWLTLWVGLWGGVFLVIGSGAGVMGGFFACLCILGAAAGPDAWLAHRCDHRCWAIESQLPNFMDHLVLGLEAGLGFEPSLGRSIEHERSILGDELSWLMRQLDRGMRRERALELLLERSPSGDLRDFVAAVRRSDRLGTPLAKTLRMQGGLLRQRRRRRAQEASRRLPVLIVFPLVLFFLPALMIIYLAPPLLHFFLGR
jgi:pilus assembly protein TadC